MQWQGNWAKLIVEPHTLVCKHWSKRYMPQNRHSRWASIARASIPGHCAHVHNLSTTLKCYWHSIKLRVRCVGLLTQSMSPLFPVEQWCTNKIGHKNRLNFCAQSAKYWN